ncbi:MAG TPA: porphobilinogen synthase [Ktedonobacterales bacterium]|jgi:porphobilinogen synthase|nr:porphobilinogen synthase [Ktedonobacterales bacterium]
MPELDLFAADTAVQRAPATNVPHVSREFPARRLRRLRRTEGMRRLVRETQLDPADFIYPMFVSEVVSEPVPIASMPGQYQWPVEALAEQAEALAAQRIGGVILFGIPAHKDEVGSAAYDDQGIIQRAIRRIKSAVPELLVVTDVCLCEYTSHGHCGIVRDGDVLNDETLALLAREAISHVDAGADIVAPSDMMDGRVAAIRAALDGRGYSTVPIMAYSAKYASAFYGPFREAAESAPQFGDRRSYQMDPANGREALREVALDIAEGADIIMVKPALPYLDVLARARDHFDLPLAAYNVSGEYAMLKAAVANGWLEERRATLELLTGIKRAGAEIILTYHAREAATWLAEA